jgi:hypothetical protein
MQIIAKPTADPIGDLVRALPLPHPAVLQSTVNQLSVRHRGTPRGSTANTQAIDKTLQSVQEQLYSKRVEDLLQKAGIDNAPVDLYRIAETLYLGVHEASLDGIDGCIVSMGEVGAILLNSDNYNRHRRRFTLAHEIGHFLLHRNIQRTYSDTDATMNDYHTREEHEANIFAAILLMPASLLPHNFGVEKPSFEQAKRLQEVFDVSLVAALRRMVSQSNWGCALVVSQDSKIKWSARSEFFYGWIPSRVHHLSGAAQLMESDELPEIVDTLPAQVWLELSTRKDDDERQYIREHSRRMGDGYVYTLLSLPDSVS